MNKYFIDQLSWPAFLGLPIYQSASFFNSPVHRDQIDKSHCRPSYLEWLLIGSSFGFLAIFDVEFKILLQAFRLEGFSSITSIILFPFEWDEISCLPFKKDIYNGKDKDIAQIEHSKLFEDFFSQMTISSEKHYTSMYGPKHPLSTSVNQWNIRVLVAGKGYRTPHCSLWELSSNGEQLLPLAVIYHSLATIHIPVRQIIGSSKLECISVPLSCLNVHSLLNRTSVAFSCLIF